LKHLILETTGEPWAFRRHAAADFSRNSVSDDARGRSNFRQFKEVQLPCQSWISVLLLAETRRPDISSLRKKSFYAGPCSLPRTVYRPELWLGVVKLTSATGWQPAFGPLGAEVRLRIAAVSGLWWK
jgi:hypothetical protein